MNKSNKVATLLILIGITLIVFCYWSVAPLSHALSYGDWLTIICSIILGIIVGVTQVRVTNRKLQGLINKKTMIFWWIASISFFVGGKILISLVIQTATLGEGDNIYVKLLLTIAGLFLGRGYAVLVKLGSRKIPQPI